MSSYTRLVMLGAAPETRGSIAAAVDAYRLHGLFKRWPIEYLPTHGDGGPARNAGLAFDALRRFAALLARHGNMPVHLHLSPRGGGMTAAARDWAFATAARAARCPLVLQLHGAGFERSHGEPLMRTLLERAACVLIACEAQRAWVRSLARNAHTVCLSHPVSQEAPQASARGNLVLFLGRMEAGKGIFDLLEAVAALRGAVPDVRLVCAGDGDRIAVARYAERLGIADAVKFTGWVGPSGKRALFESAAVFALPAYDASLPVSLPEAMAAGVPVVASSVGGIPEIVSDGTSGLLVAPGDKASLERALRKLLTDAARAARIGAAGRETARLRFAPERALAPLEEIYGWLGLQLPAPVVGLRGAA
jgi:glycosyltransferase involved in cell wall biosynthesis